MDAAATTTARPANITAIVQAAKLLCMEKTAARFAMAAMVATIADWMSVAPGERAL